MKEPDWLVRVVEYYSNRTDERIGVFSLPRIELSELQRLWSAPPDEPMVDSFAIEEEQALFFRELAGIEFDFTRFSYMLVACTTDREAMRRDGGFMGLFPTSYTSIDEIEPELQRLSDTEILLNFARAMSALYPYMKVIRAHCYDRYDEVVEPLFHSLVYSTFAGKYGAILPAEACHVYDGVTADYKLRSHILVRPRSLPIQAMSDQGPIEITDDFLARRDLLFITFGDGVHNLTGGENEGDSYDVTFDLTQVQVCDADSRDESGDRMFLWMPNDALEYELVLHPGAVPGSDY